eukprot:c24900_g1_i1 orf=110-1450(+)
MAGVHCPRSLKQALMSALSTFALFVAANCWEMSFLVGDPKLVDLLSRILHATFAFTVPAITLYLSMWNAAQVWAVKRSLQRKMSPQHVGDGSNVKASQHPLDDGSVAILTLCPIFIRIPQRSPPTTNPTPPTQALESTQTPPPTQPLEPTQAFLEDKTWDQIKELYPSRLAPRDVANDGDAMLDTRAQGSNGYKFYKVCDTTSVLMRVLLDTKRVQARVALLASGLAPNYKELRFLRSRNSFQTVVTLIQASGNLVGLVQRMAQHVAISPLEAIIFYLSVLVALQLLIELYACGNYQRPLLLHLTLDQFDEFCEELNKDKTTCSLWIYPTAVLLFFIFSIPAICYFHYIHASLLSSLAALFLFLSLLLLIVHGIIVYVSKFSSCNPPKFGRLVFMRTYKLPATLLCCMLMYMCSIILATLSTITHWHTFQDPTHNSFAWIFPHVSD